MKRNLVEVKYLQHHSTLVRQYIPPTPTTPLSNTLLIKVQSITILGEKVLAAHFHIGNIIVFSLTHPPPPPPLFSFLFFVSVKMIVFSLTFLLQYYFLFINVRCIKNLLEGKYLQHHSKLVRQCIPPPLSNSLLIKVQS